MRKAIVPALIIMALSGTPSFGQDTTTDMDTQRAAEAADREDRGEWGWLGLAGLLGLKRRDDRIGRTSRDSAASVR
jgi:hypothetical protein